MNKIVFSFRARCGVSVCVLYMLMNGPFCLLREQKSIE